MTLEPRMLLSIGNLVAAIALVWLLVVLRRAFYENPDATASVFTSLGLPAQPTNSQMLFVGIRYALLRRTYPAFQNTDIERQRNKFALLYIAVFIGTIVALIGLCIPILAGV